MGASLTCLSPKAAQADKPKSVASPEAVSALPAKTTSEKIELNSYVTTPNGLGTVKEFKSNGMVVVKLVSGAIEVLSLKDLALKTVPVAAPKPVVIPSNLKVFPGCAVVTPFGKGVAEACRGNGTSFVVILEFGAKAYLNAANIDLPPFDLAPNSRVITKYGPGNLLSAGADKFCVVQFDFGGKGYLNKDEVCAPTFISLKKEQEIQDIIKKTAQEKEARAATSGKKESSPKKKEKSPAAKPVVAEAPVQPPALSLGGEQGSVTITKEEESVKKEEEEVKPVVAQEAPAPQAAQASSKKNKKKR